MERKVSFPGRCSRSGWWHGRLRNCGYRLTFPRQAIMEFLQQTGGHFPVEEIYRNIHKTFLSIGLTTVYRTLEVLVEMGLVSRLDFGDGKSRYELSFGSGGKHHHHLCCTGCGRIVDYQEFLEEEKKVIKNIEKALSRKHNFQINEHQIQFLGLCHDCRGKEVK